MKFEIKDDLENKKVEFKATLTQQELNEIFKESDPDFVTYQDSFICDILKSCQTRENVWDLIKVIRLILCKNK